MMKSLFGASKKRAPSQNYARPRPIIGEDSPRKPSTPQPVLRSPQTANASNIIGPNTLVIGIDFGTTYTGCAIAQSSKVQDVTDRMKIAESIEVLKRWPGAGNASAEKTPSILAYDSEFTHVLAWGSSVTENHKNRFAHFKLLLHRPSSSDANASVDSLAWEVQATSLHSSSLPRGKTALDVSADYFRCLYQYVQTVLQNTYGEKFLSTQQLSYVVTVPALWSDRSKALTLRAANEGGFTGKVTLVTEPEAAAVYCATLCEEVDLRVGSKFLVCDAGGGTVDLISYEVDSIKPFMISECSIGTAGACGSIFLDRAFEAAVRAKLGNHAEQVLKPRSLSELMRYFNHFIKVEFKDDENVPFINFAVPGAPDLPEADIEGGFMSMSREELRGIFLPLFQKVLDLVRGQIEQVNGKFGSGSLKHVFLVGGLGSNIFLHRYLQQSLPREVVVKQPMNSWTAVVRGAVMYGLNSHIVKERILRRHYGIATSIVWDGAKHPVERRWKDHLDGTWRVDVMKWYVVKGQRVEDAKKVEVTLFYNFDDDEVLIRTCKLLSCDRDVAPLYPDDPSIDQVCELQADLTSIPPREFQQKRSANGAMYYQLLYAIAMTFKNSITFELIFNQKAYETVLAKY